MTTPFRSWVISTRRAKPPRMRLFCFPHAGGGPSAYRLWQSLVPEDIEVCAVQLPGREMRWNEPPFTRLDALVDAALAALEPSMELPFAFFGHSMGALVSDLPWVHSLPEAELMAFLRLTHGTPLEVLQDPELMEVILPLFRADVGMVETYVHAHEDPLDCPISAFGGYADAHVSESELAAWQHQTRREFSLTMFPGGHFYLQPHQAELVGRIVSALKTSKA